MARRVKLEHDEKIGEFLQECDELRQIVKGVPLSLEEYRIVKAHLDALLADLDASIKRDELPH
jgi:hypothetical protein